MDQYGCYRNTKDDFDELAANYKATRNILFAYSENQIDCINICLNGSFRKLGTMPFGGNPTGRIWISCYGKGVPNHFSFKDKYPYISEKMHVEEWCAKWIQNILNEIGDRVK